MKQIEDPERVYTWSLTAIINYQRIRRRMEIKRMYIGETLPTIFGLGLLDGPAAPVKPSPKPVTAVLFS